jgi:hypothetical protein
MNGKIKLPVETWYHLAYVYKGTTVSIYANGTLSQSQSYFLTSSTVNVVREPNYIGMGEGLNRVYVHISNTVLDEIKLFNKALTPEQILLDMNAVNGIAPGIC